MQGHGLAACRTYSCQASKRVPARPRAVRCGPGFARTWGRSYRQRQRTGLLLGFSDSTRPPVDSRETIAFGYRRDEARPAATVMKQDVNQPMQASQAAAGSGNRLIAFGRGAPWRSDGDWEAGSRRARMRPRREQGTAGCIGPDQCRTRSCSHEHACCRSPFWYLASIACLCRFLYRT